MKTQVGHLDLLVNNAGLSQVGAVVDLSRDDLRRQYETEVPAPVAVTSLAMPLLRAAVTVNGSASVAMVGSIVGLLTTPFAGAYCSSKAAVHRLTDALRMELKPFGGSACDSDSSRAARVLPPSDHAEAAIRLPPGSDGRSGWSTHPARAQAGQRDATPAGRVRRASR